ncbi:MAG: hypothetical protein OXE50_12935 [Chloroflexi bacterium]|nr:hypothetical protein [Chloroflexota bacterium]
MTTTGKQPIESHAVHRDALLDHAERMIEAGDRLQASEKMWGAAAHGLKVIAKARNWHFETHADAFVIAHHVASFVGNDALWTKFLAMDSYHQNFYEDQVPLEGIRASLRDARELVGLLRDADRTIPPDAPMPTERNYLSRAQAASGRAPAGG